MTSTIASVTSNGDDLLDPHVAAQLHRVRGQLIERLWRRVSRRRRLWREAVVEAVAGLVGGLTASIALVLRPHAGTSFFILGLLALAACSLSAFDMRRIRALDVQIRSLARAVAALV